MKKDQAFLKNLAAQQAHEQESTNLGIYESRDVLLGIDYGEKHTGLAICENGVILPLEILITDNRSLITELDKICNKRKISRVIWGLPLGVNNEENHICEAIKKLAEKLKKKTGLPYELVNERYSSSITDQAGKERRGEGAKPRIDDLAAMRILEFYLDSLSSPHDAPRTQ